MEFFDIFFETQTSTDNSLVFTPNAFSAAALLFGMKCHPTHSLNDSDAFLGSCWNAHSVYLSFVLQFRFCAVFWQAISVLFQFIAAPRWFIYIVALQLDKKNL